MHHNKTVGTSLYSLLSPSYDRNKIYCVHLLYSILFSDEASRCGALVEAFTEARAMTRAILVLDDIDRIVAGVGAGVRSPCI